MYIPKAFCEDDLGTLHGLMQQYSFATLITMRDGLPVASHLPLVLQPHQGPYGTLFGHMARANPQWQDFTPETEVLAIFQGPHAYVSPSWYTVHPSVPTWNYAVVHAYGIPRLIDDTSELHEVLRLLVHTYEAPRSEPWSMALPDAYLHRMMQGIVGFAMPIGRLEGKYKLSQNRPSADRQRVAEALRGRGDEPGTSLAALMRQRH